MFNSSIAMFEYPVEIGTNIASFIWFFPICILVNVVVKSMKMSVLTVNSFIQEVAKSSLRGTVMILIAWAVVFVLTYLGSM
jgi:hypothetical protein